MPSQSKAQQKFMGMVHALKKGDIEPSSVSKSVRDVAKNMKKSDAKDFASTPHKGLPKKVKQEILNKLKEYANKMGRDHLGGDDYTSKRKGGLRDFDGYDNVDYNKDMPMDEGFKSEYEGNDGIIWKKGKSRGGVTNFTPYYKGHNIDFGGHNFKTEKELKDFIKNYILSNQLYKKYRNEATKGDIMRAVKGKSNPYTLVVIKRGDVIYQKDIKNPQEVPAVYSVIRKHMDKGEKIHIEDRTGKIVFKESKLKGQLAGDSVQDIIKSIGSRFVSGEIKNTKRDGKTYIKLKDEKFGSGVVKILKSRFGIDAKIDYYGGKGKVASSPSVSFFSDTIIDESKGVPQNYMQGRTSDYHTALRGKNKDYSGGTNFKKTNHGQPDLENDEEDQETNQLSNKQIALKAESFKVAGRPVKLNKGKKKNGTDWTVTFKNGKTVPLSDVLSLIKPFPKITKESFDKVEHLKLLNLALRTMPGSQKQKEIIRKLNQVRKAGGMRPLKEKSIVEYGQRLDLSYLEDKEARLDGTPEPKDAINRDLDEGTMIRMAGKLAQELLPKDVWYRHSSDGNKNREFVKTIVRDLAQTLNRFYKSHNINVRIKENKIELDEIGVFDIKSYVKGIIPSSFFNTTTRDKKEKLKSTLRDLKSTLNHFWKQHDIPYRIK